MENENRITETAKLYTLGNYAGLLAAVGGSAGAVARMFPTTQPVIFLVCLGAAVFAFFFPKTRNFFIAIAIAFLTGFLLQTWVN
jgi:hypothetical protein